MRTLFKALCNNDLNLPGHSVIKHMHYDSSGSDRTVCEIVSKELKPPQLVLWIRLAS